MGGRGRLRLLLDTHALIWWTEGSDRLGERAAGEIARSANEVFVSAVSAMEIATKFRLGKLPQARILAEAFEEQVHAEAFVPLPVTMTHGRVAGSLQIPHRDPFDRLLIAQAMLEDLILVSNEGGFDAFGVRRLW